MLNRVEHEKSFKASGQGFLIQNNLKDLDPSCKTDLDLWDGFRREQFIAELHMAALHICGHFERFTHLLVI